MANNFLQQTAGYLANLATTPHYLNRNFSGSGNSTRTMFPNRAQRRAATSELAYTTQLGLHEADRPYHAPWDSRRAIREGYTASHYLYTCISLLAREIARPIWFMENRKSSAGKEDQWEQVNNSDFEQLMAKPNPFQSGMDLFERGGQHFYLTGNMLFLKVRGGITGKVRELWNLQPDQIKPVPSREHFLSHYEFMVPGEAPIAIDVNDIVHIMIANPVTPFWGMSPLAAMGTLIDTEVDAMAWWRWSIRNRAAKDGILKYKRFLTDEEYTKVKQQLIEQVTGPWNARLPMILSGDGDWIPNSNTAVEMDFVDLRKMTREEICGGMGVWPILVGIQDHSTYNNVSEARLGLWQDNLLGQTDKFRAALDLQLLPDFADTRRFRTNIDLSRIPALLKHLAEMADSVEKYWGMGVPFNDLNRRFNLGFRPLQEDIGDISWINGQPAEAGLKALEEPEEPPVTRAELQALAEGKPPAFPPEGGGKKPLALPTPKDDPEDDDEESGSKSARGWLPGGLLQR